MLREAINLCLNLGTRSTPRMSNPSSEEQEALKKVLST